MHALLPKQHTISTHLLRKVWYEVVMWLKCTCTLVRAASAALACTSCSHSSWRHLQW